MTDKGREEARKVMFYSEDLQRDIEVEYIDLKTNTFRIRPYPREGFITLDGAHRLFDRIRAEARGELCTNCETRIRAEERQRAAEKEPGTVDGYILMIQRHVRELEAWKIRSAAIIADDKNHIPDVGNMADDKEKV